MQTTGALPSSLWRAGFFDESPIPCALVAAGGEFLHVNDSYAQLVGYAEGELVGGLRWQDISDPRDVAGDQAGKRKIITGERDEYSMLKRYITKSGTVIWVNLHVRSFRDQGQFVCFTTHAVPVVGAGEYRTADNRIEVVAQPSWVELVKRYPLQTGVAGFALASFLGKDLLAALLAKLIAP